jgi:hypothetical protein
MGLSLKAYRVTLEQAEYARRKSAEGAIGSATSQNDWARYAPVSAEEEEAQLAKILEASVLAQ